MAPTVGEDLELLKALRRTSARLHVPYSVCRKILLLQLELLGDAKEVTDLFVRHVAPALAKRKGLREDLRLRLHEFGLHLTSATLPLQSEPAPSPSGKTDSFSL